MQLAKFSRRKSRLSTQSCGCFLHFTLYCTVLLLFCCVSQSEAWLGSKFKKVLKDVSKGVDKVLDNGGQLCLNRCNWGQWGGWSACSRSCGGGERVRKRDVCNWAWLEKTVKLEQCGLLGSEHTQHGQCAQYCVHGMWSTYSDQCNCYTGYRGHCCEIIIPKRVTSKPTTRPTTPSTTTSTKVPSSLRPSTLYAKVSTTTPTVPILTSTASTSTKSTSKSSNTDRVLTLSRGAIATTLSTSMSESERNDVTGTETTAQNLTENNVTRLESLEPFTRSHVSTRKTTVSNSTASSSQNKDTSTSTPVTITEILASAVVTEGSDQTEIIVVESDTTEAVITHPRSLQTSPGTAEHSMYVSQQLSANGTDFETVTKKITTANAGIVFLVGLHNVTKLPGESVVFDCGTVPATDAYWFLNGRPLAGDTPDYQFLPRGVLLIPTVSAPHAGQYACEAVSVDSTARTSAWLSVVTPHTDSCSLEVKIAPENITVPVGSLCVLKCHGSSGSEVTWYKTSETTSNQESDMYGNGLIDYSDYQYTEDLRGLNRVEQYDYYEHVERTFIGSTWQYKPDIIDQALSRLRMAGHENQVGSAARVLSNGFLMITSASINDRGQYTCEIQKDNCTAMRTATLTVYRDKEEICGTQVHNTTNLHGGSKQEGFIAGGENVKKGAAPWQVLLAETWVGFFCGGVLIDRYWVATAAHCFRLFSRRHHRHLHAGNLLLKFGKHFRQGVEQHEQVRKMVRKVIHPFYDPRLFSYDIVLIRLRSPVILTDYVRPVCLPTADNKGFTDAIKAGSSGIVTGWGRVSDNGPRSHVLNGIHIPIQDIEVCRNSTEHFVPTAAFCAGYGSDDVKHDACKGDSGGPLVVPVTQSDLSEQSHQTKWHLAGLVSWGEKCGGDGVFGFYVNTTTVVDWIHRVIDYT